MKGWTANFPVIQYSVGESLEWYGTIPKGQKSLNEIIEEARADWRTENEIEQLVRKRQISEWIVSPAPRPHN